MKKLIYAVFIAMTLYYSSFAAGYCTDRGSALLGGMMSFSSTTYEGGSDPWTAFTLVPLIDCFVAPHFFIGPALSVTSQSHGSSSSTLFGIGGNIGFAYGIENSKAIPYVGIGYQHLSYESESGYSIPLAGGIIFPIKQHFGLTMQVGYDMMDQSGESVNTFAFSIGFIGLIF